jgi:hypothetical protein
VEARFNAAMDAVLNGTVRRVSHTTGTSTGVSTHVADMNARNDTDDRNIASGSENNLNLNSRVLNEGELPDIDQPISDESYPSNSDFSYRNENEIYDKTPEFDPEWDPG